MVGSPGALLVVSVVVLIGCAGAIRLMFAGLDERRYGPTLVYNDRTVDGEWIHAPDASAGDVTVEVIVDAIAETTR